MKYLFLCAIGPVQDFIATARRSRDLAFGSELLSELSKAGAKALADEFGCDNLILPAPKDMDDLQPGSEYNVANRILAIVEQEPQKVSNIVEYAIRKRLQETSEQAFRQVKGDFDKSLAYDQINDLIEFYWASVEYNESNYIQNRKTVEALLAARKNTRDFKQATGSHRPKSSLDGSRESVIPEKEYPAFGDPDKEKARKINTLYINYGARRAEQLSGVDLLKRNGKITQKFHSTSYMAALPFLMGLEKREQFEDEILQIMGKFGITKGGEEEPILFESRISDYIPDKDEQEKFRGQLNAILKKYAGNKRPSPYYAMLLADGDNMGKAIDRQSSIDDHKKISEALSDFSIQAKNIIQSEENAGVPIYVGGDDVLAYLPLHTALQCSKALEEAFRKQMEPFGDNSVQPTLSGGIVIAHHLTPLSEVLDLARSAERIAKSVEGKNALAITLSKRSGTERTVVDKWSNLSERLNIPLLSQIPIVQSIREGGDNGNPSAIDENSITGKAFAELGRRVAEEVDKRNAELSPTKKVEITNTDGCAAAK